MRLSVQPARSGPRAGGLALGADVCNAARGMMLALGCIQAQRCNSNDRPVGVATQDPSLVVGLVPRDKAVRVANYQRQTVHALCELVGAAGLQGATHLRPEHTMRTYSELFVQLPGGALVDDLAPTRFEDWSQTGPDSFAPHRAPADAMAAA